MCPKSSNIRTFKLQYSNRIVFCEIPFPGRTKLTRGPRVVDPALCKCNKKLNYSTSKIRNPNSMVTKDLNPASSTGSGTSFAQHLVCSIKMSVHVHGNSSFTAVRSGRPEMSEERTSDTPSMPLNLSLLLVIL